MSIRRSDILTVKADAARLLTGEELRRCEAALAGTAPVREVGKT